MIATAPGVIIGKEDGHFDQNCDLMVEAEWNAIYIQHEDGSQTWYGHLKQNSLTPKGVGETVERGEYLGLVGSSGISNGPHLHLELYDNAGNLIDPFQGNCSEQLDSWWTAQRPYYDSGINRLSTHTAPPQWTDCAELIDTHASNDFCPSDTIYFMAFLRDQLAGQVLHYKIHQPNGDLYAEWTDMLEDATHYSASYWYFPLILRKDVEGGIWKYQIEYLDQIYTHEFGVCETVSSPSIPLELLDNGIFPNPTQQQLQVKIEIFQANDYTFDIRDVNTRTLTTHLHSLLIGQHQLEFDVNTLPSGLYLLTVSDYSGTLATRRFVKR